MKSISQILNVLKTLYTSVQQEAYWWARTKIDLVLCNILKDLFIH
jgi:hypothetical protein